MFELKTSAELYIFDWVFLVFFSISGHSESPVLKQTGVKNDLKNARCEIIKKLTLWLSWTVLILYLLECKKSCKFRLTMSNMYRLPWRNTFHQTGFFCRSIHFCLLGEMAFYFIQSRILEFSFNTENKSFIIRKDDLEIIWWLVLFPQDLGILILTHNFQNLLT